MFLKEETKSVFEKDEAKKEAKKAIRKRLLGPVEFSSNWFSSLCVVDLTRSSTFFLLQCI
jgi:hypothetical protein